MPRLQNRKEEDDTHPLEVLPQLLQRGLLLRGLRRSREQRARLAACNLRAAVRHAIRTAVSAGAALLHLLCRRAVLCRFSHPEKLSQQKRST